MPKTKTKSSKSTDPVEVQTRNESDTIDGDSQSLLTLEEIKEFTEDAPVYAKRLKDCHTCTLS